RPLHLVERRIVTSVTFAQGCGDHLGDADIFGPLDALFLGLPELAHAEVRTLSFQPMIGQDLLDFTAVCQRFEVASVTDRRTQLEPRNADVSHGFGECRKVLEHGPKWINLTSNGETERIGSELYPIGEQEPGCAGRNRCSLHKSSS